MFRLCAGKLDTLPVDEIFSLANVDQFIGACLCLRFYVSLSLSHLTQTGSPQAPPSRPRFPVIVVASLVEKAPNLAGLTRTCEIFNVQELCVENLEVSLLSFAFLRFVSFGLVFKSDLGFCLGSQ